MSSESSRAPSRSSVLTYLGSSPSQFSRGGGGSGGGVMQMCALLNVVSRSYSEGGDLLRLKNPALWCGVKWFESGADEPNMEYRRLA